MDPQAPPQPTPPPDMQPPHPGPAAPPPPPAPHPGQPYPGHTPYPAEARTNIFAILSLILAFLFPLLGLIFGFVAMSQIKRTNEQGKGLALAGTIVSGVFVALTILWFLLVVVSMIASQGSSGTTTTY